MPSIKGEFDAQEAHTDASGIQIELYSLDHDSGVISYPEFGIAGGNPTHENPCTSFYLADDRLTIDIGRAPGLLKAYHGFHGFLSGPLVVMAGTPAVCMPLVTERVFVIQKARRFFCSG